MVNGKRDRFFGGSHDSMADATAAYEARRVKLGLDPDPQQCEKSYHNWTSKYIGVYQQESRCGRWTAQIKVGAGRSMILGHFNEADEEGAVRVYAAARAARDALREAGVPDEEIVKVLNLKTRRAPHEPPLVPEALIARCGEHGVVLAQNERGCWNGPANPRAAVVDLPSAEDGLWRHESVGVHWVPAVRVAGLTTANGSTSAGTTPKPRRSSSYWKRTILVFQHSVNKFERPASKLYSFENVMDI
jgi:hypothetical protein